jgi:hypothetical protein
MGSLTSQLIISLIDKVSGPAKSVAAALKGVEAAEKGLSSKGGAGDNLANTLRKTAAAADALNKKKLTADFSKGFTDQLGKMNLAQAQIDRLRSSFEKFQNTLKSGGRMKADFLPKLDTWERDTLGSLKRASKAQADYSRRRGRAEDVKRGMTHIAAPYVSGYAAVHAGKAAIEQTAELQREKVREDLAGMSPEDRASSMGIARNLSGKFKSVGQVEVLEHQRKLRGTLGDLHHAQEMVEDIVKSQVVLSSGPGGKEGAVRDLDQITKGLEGAGYAGSPDKFRRMLAA